MTTDGNGRVVVITGANGSIGSHLPDALVDEGYRVAGLDVEGIPPRGAQRRPPQKVGHHACDVSNEDDVKAAAD